MPITEARLFDMASEIHGCVEWSAHESAKDLLRRALAEAWGEGHESGYSDGADDWANRGTVNVTPNPYRPL